MQHLWMKQIHVWYSTTKVNMVKQRERWSVQLSLYCSCGHTLGHKRPGITVPFTPPKLLSLSIVGIPPLVGWDLGRWGREASRGQVGAYKPPWHSKCIMPFVSTPIWGRPAKVLAGGCLPWQPTNGHQKCMAHCLMEIITPWGGQ